MVELDDAGLSITVSMLWVLRDVSINSREESHIKSYSPHVEQEYSSHYPHLTWLSLEISIRRSTTVLHVVVWSRRLADSTRSILETKERSCEFGNTKTFVVPGSLRVLAGLFLYVSLHRLDPSLGGITFIAKDVSQSPHLSHARTRISAVFVPSGIK